MSIASEVDVKILIRWFGRGCYDFLSEFHAAGLACPNLYFDVGAVTQSGGIKYLAEKIGQTGYTYAQIRQNFIHCRAYFC